MLAEISINLPLKTTKHFKDLIQMNSATSRTRYYKSAHCCPNVQGQVPYLIEQITYFCKNQSLCYFLCVIHREKWKLRYRLEKRKKIKEIRRFSPTPLGKHNMIIITILLIKQLRTGVLYSFFQAEYLVLVVIRCDIIWSLGLELFLLHHVQVQ